LPDGGRDEIRTPGYGDDSEVKQINGLAAGQRVPPENVEDAAPGAEDTGLEIEYGIDPHNGDRSGRVWRHLRGRCGYEICVEVGDGVTR
jgi:hypothetical protein